jgi:hypothetical protein
VGDKQWICSVLIAHLALIDKIAHQELTWIDEGAINLKTISFGLQLRQLQTVKIRSTNKLKDFNSSPIITYILYCVPH